MFLEQTTLTGVNISSELQVLTYHYVEIEPTIVMCRVDLSNIVGGGDYDVRAYVNGNLVVPDIAVPVPSGSTKVHVQGRNLLLASGDTITITIIGLPADTFVDVTTSLMNNLPISAEDAATIISATIEANLTQAVTAALKGLSIQPERVVIGACDRPSSASPMAKPQQVVESPRAKPQQVVEIPRVL